MEDGQSHGNRGQRAVGPGAPRTPLPENNVTDADAWLLQWTRPRPAGPQITPSGSTRFQRHMDELPWELSSCLRSAGRRPPAPWVWFHILPPDIAEPTDPRGSQDWLSSECRPLRPS